MTHLVKTPMGLWSSRTFNQDGQCYYNQMGHATYLSTIFYNLPTYLPTYRPTYLPAITYLSTTYLPSFLPTYYNLPTYLPTYYNLFTYLPTRLPPYIFIYLLATHLLAYPPTTHLLTLTIYLLTYLIVS
jgi:hypothetical protein